MHFAFGDCLGEQTFMAAFYQAGKTMPMLLFLDRTDFFDWHLAIEKDSVLPPGSAWNVASIKDINNQYWNTILILCRRRSLYQSLEICESPRPFGFMPQKILN
jgi:hypothetical protein